MRPETRAYLAKAREDLRDAKIIAAVGLLKVAARSAYYEGFHTAEALVIERTGKVAKTHSGLRAVLSQLVNADSGIDKSFQTFLAQTYKYKEIGDYSVGDDLTVTTAEAEDAIVKAEAFIDSIEMLLGEP